MTPKTTWQNPAAPRVRRHPSERLAAAPPVIDTPGDSADVQRYRRFFAEHDINGLPCRSDVARPPGR